MELSGKQIKEYKNRIPVDKYIENEEYYRGDNSKILNEPEKKKPDNRVPIAFANRLIKNLTGYAARPGDIKIELVQDAPEGADEPENAYISAFAEIAEKNHFHLLNSQLYKSVLTHGIAYDLTWTEADENGELIVKCAPIPVYQCAPIWSNDLSTIRKLDAFIRYYKKDMPEIIQVPEKGPVLLEPGDYATVFYPGKYEIWQLSEKTDDRRPQNFEPRKKADFPQPFDDVQVTVYMGNEDLLPYWTPVKRIIDVFDKTISKNVNEVDRFNDTILLLMQKLSPEVKAKIEQAGLMDNIQNAVKEGISDVWPRFLERNVPTEHSKLMLDKLEALLYTIIGVPSFLDESFNGASGVALLFRLIGLEYAAVETDNYFDLGLFNREMLIRQAITGGAVRFEGSTIPEAVAELVTPEVTHKRNLPMDVRSIVEDALKLKALGISMETILKYLPSKIVDDVAEELERVEAQREKSLEMFQQTGGRDPEDDDGDE